MNNNILLEALHKGVQYLLKCQNAKGYWEDYQLPVGSSDAWITGFTGLTLASIPDWEHNDFIQFGIKKAVRWLTCNRAYPMGWGFNGTTGPDTDTTAYVLAFLLKVKEKVKNSDLTWLLEQWQPSGGFSTYKGPQAWGVAHADVTPLAYMVLPTQQQVLLKPELLKFLEKNQLSDGTWPAYWWRTNFYSTFLNWQLCRELELEIPIGYLNNLGEVHSIFELAFVLGLFSFQAGLNDLKEVLLEELVARQSQEGGWEGGYNLRVTALDCYTPWVESHGELYKDNRGILTTASVIWMLRRFIYNETCL